MCVCVVYVSASRPVGPVARRVCVRGSARASALGALGTAFEAKLDACVS